MTQQQMQDQADNDIEASYDTEFVPAVRIALEAMIGKRDTAWVFNRKAIGDMLFSKFERSWTARDTAEWLADDAGYIEIDGEWCQIEEVAAARAHAQFSRDAYGE